LNPDVAAPVGPGREARALSTETYSPINVLKPVCDDVWIVDGPLIRFGLPWPKLPFPTRMTIVRTGERDLFVHSPTPLTPQLRAQVEAIGRPRWLVGPNRIHYWWIPDWKAAFPEAEVWLAPGIAERAGDRVAFSFQPLDGAGAYPWDGPLATLPAQSRYMTEYVFFHRPSATLILTDLIENFEPAKLSGRVMRWLTRLGGVQDPDGSMPRDMRMTFSGRKMQLRSAVATMIAWRPERIILAHGRWYDRDGAAELRRAFRWLLES
jgi:hypothetical protein